MRNTLLMALLVCSCAQRQRAGSEPDSRAAAEAYQLLIGRYDSSAQAAKDPAFKTIHLAICPALAPDLGDRVLYVEQAAAEALDKPYRQRLYVLEDRGPGEAASRVFELKEPASAVGLCQRGGSARFERAQVEERQGCEVGLRQAAPRSFVGSTRGKQCTSSLRGASYATSEVRLVENGLTSWDRGFDSSDTQVWGATSGPYVFVRQPPR